MPVFTLIKEPIFPPVHLAEEDGLLAVGGDLHPTRLLEAYHQGIFPWYNEDEEILWWSPDPRCVLFPDKLIIQKSMRPILRSSEYRFALNENFESVISNCANVKRHGQSGTWITPDMKKSYIELHHMGYALSAECYIKNELCGGLYGILLDGIFCGESMFSLKPNASKYAFIHLISHLKRLDVKLIDCQVYTPHLESLGAEMITRKDYLRYLPPR
jgi:leucyl/phenylalanyl-tRNA--protein transferase